MSWRVRAGKPPEGWGEDPDKIEALIKDDAEALEMWGKETTRGKGGDRRSDSFKDDNVNFEKPKKGTSKAHSLSVLKRKAPDMFQAEKLYGSKMWRTRQPWR
jgi:hypothetical protein